MTLQRDRHLGRPLVPQARRPLDVGEQEGDSPRRPLSHAGRLIQPQTWGVKTEPTPAHFYARPRTSTDESEKSNKTEGRVEIKPGIFIWGNYTYDDASSLSIIYENLVAPLYDFTISISENTLEMKLEGEPGVILSRETPGEGLIGKWKGKPDNGPPVDVIYEFTDTNKVYVSVQFQKAKQGKYTFIDKTVSESFSKGNTFSFQLVEQEGMYFLKNTENGEIVYQKRTY